MTLEKIKIELYKQCIKFVDSRINNSLFAIKSAQESANTEMKSSAGDKHETGRSMAQLETEKNAIQLAESNKLRHVIGLINPEVKHNKVELGALVITNYGQYYISVSVGKITLDDSIYFGVSAVSPIGQAFLNHKKGDKIVFNGRKFLLKEIA